MSRVASCIHQVFFSSIACACTACMSAQVALHSDDPPGWTGDDCMAPLKRPCTHRYRTAWEPVGVAMVSHCSRVYWFVSRLPHTGKPTLTCAQDAACVFEDLPGALRPWGPQRACNLCCAVSRPEWGSPVDNLVVVVVVVVGCKFAMDWVACMALSSLKA